MNRASRLNKVGHHEVHSEESSRVCIQLFISSFTLAFESFIGHLLWVRLWVR